MRAASEIQTRSPKANAAGSQPEVQLRNSPVSATTKVAATRPSSNTRQRQRRSWLKRACPPASATIQIQNKLPVDPYAYSLRIVFAAGLRSRQTM